MQAADFSYLNVILDCPRKFFHRFEEQLVPHQKSTPMHSGSALHEALATLYGYDPHYWLSDELSQIPPDTVARAGLEDFFGDHYNPAFEYMTLGHLETVLLNYIDHWQDQEPYTVAHLVEEPLTMELGGLLIGGKPDLIVDDGGQPLVMDHKCTTGYLGAKIYNRTKFSHQLRIYCLLASEHFGEPVRQGVCNAVYMGKYASAEKSKANKFDRYVFTYTEEQLAETKAWLGECQGLINYFGLLYGEEEDAESFYPQCGSDACGWCEFSTLCEATPSLREMRKQTEFTKKKFDGILLSGADSDD